MSSERAGAGHEALRRAFDESFAVPVVAPACAQERLLLVGLGGARFALRIDEIEGLHEGRRIVPIPGGSSVFLGLAGVRGWVVSVFDLAALLGAGAPPPRRPWIVLARARERVGLLVAEIEGHVDVARTAIHGAVDAEGADRAARTRHVVAVAEVGGALVSVVSVPSVLRAIAALGRAGAATGGL